MKQPPFYLNQKTLYILLVACVLIISGLACNVPIQSLSSVDLSDNQNSTNQVETAIVKTLTARAPEIKDEMDSNGAESSEGESEGLSAAVTPSITPSPTVTLTPTPERPLVYISGNTNCRFGPGEVYDLIHTYLAGESAYLVGKNLSETFWFTQDQERGSINCWLWGKYATPEGNIADLPVFTPPPTPTPAVDFTITYKNTFCGGKEIIVKIKNTGELTLESFTATFKDTVTSETTTKSSSQFNGSVVKILVGKTAELTGNSFSVSTIGHKITAVIKICTKDGQQGLCVTRTAQFESQ